MNKFLFGSLALLAFSVSGPASAADMPVKAPVSRAPVIVYNWTGFYIGVNGGYGWDDRSFDLVGDNDAGRGLITGIGFSPASGRFDVRGFVAGGQLGYNWHLAPALLVGIEADINFSDVRGSRSFTATSGGLATFPTNVDQRLTWFATLRARLGVLLAERLLVFATGGLAYGHFKANADIAIAGGAIDVGSLFDGTVIFCGIGGPGPCLRGSGSRTSAGWTVGGGWEYAAGNNWSFKAEYLYVDLGTQAVRMTTVPPALGNGALSARFDTTTINIVRAGINYRFGAAPVIARY